MEDPTRGIRIQKYLSQAGICSRRKAEELMRAGRVTVNGVPATEMGLRVVPEEDDIVVDGQTVEQRKVLVYLALYKPRNMITSLDDPEGRPVVAELIPPGTPRVWPVGRLDWDSEGLLMMTNDGDLTHLVTHPSHHVEKSYIVKLRGRLESSDPTLEAMRKPLTLDDGFVTSGADVTVVSHTSQHTWIQVTLHEGHNRQIRRMAEAVGHTVLRLKRTHIGNIALDPLKPGQWRSITPEEIFGLYDLVGATPPKRPRTPKGSSKSRSNRSGPAKQKASRAPGRHRTPKGRSKAPSGRKKR
ncbi:MAG: pseudouridine synthase [Myxococcota bacterium]